GTWNVPATLGNVTWNVPATLGHGIWNVPATLGYGTWNVPATILEQVLSTFARRRRYQAVPILL
ncbi:MAG: hypothetical protein ACKOOI_20575, partial [Pirellula sp.]